MITPGKYDIAIYQGATFELQVQYKSNAGVPINMSGYTIVSKLYNRLGTDKLADFAVSYVNQASGIFKIRLEASGTSGITEQGQYDILITEPSNDAYYILEGNAYLNRGLSFQ
jgi:hypothetical protein